MNNEQPLADNGNVPLKSRDGELLFLYYTQAERVLLTGGGGAALVMAILIAQYVPIQYPLAWLAAKIAANVAHPRLLRYLARDTKMQESRKLHIVSVSFALHGVVFSAVQFFFPFVPALPGSIITIYAVGVVASALHAFAGHGKTFTPFLLILMIPAAAVWAFSDAPEVGMVERVVLVGLAIAYCWMMSQYAAGAFSVFEESYRIRLQREELTARLSTALSSAESANAAKTRFLASASHDLRQPMHALSLFSGSLRMRPLDSKTAIIAERIDDSVKILASQLDALLDISRLDAGVILPDLTLVDLSGLIEGVVEQFGDDAARKQLYVRVDVPPRIVAVTDGLLLRRILSNLLSNAIKYTEMGGVHIRAECVGETCNISVVDTGPGIPREEQERVFEEFYQLENPERDRTKGLGLGLAIVRRLSTLLNIRTTLVSGTGNGTTVAFEVPTTARMLKAQETAQHPSEVPAGLRVLVIDDEESVRLGMQTLLEGAGATVELASTAASALAVQSRFLPHIVFADYRLRGSENGVDVIKALRQKFENLPALLISGDTAPDRLREAHAAGIELLHKPVSADALIGAILRHVPRPGC